MAAVALALSGCGGGSSSPTGPGSPPSYTLNGGSLNPVPVTAGHTATSTVTLTPVNGYTGSINLSCGSISGGTQAPTCTFSPATVPVNGGAPATATLTVSTLVNTPGGTLSLSSGSESIFELKFDLQNPSAYNTLTYTRDDALRTDVAFLAAENLNTFFQSRPDDKRSALVDYVNVDVSIQPDGRTQKYRGEQTKDNSGYIIRLAEVYLIRAEALGKTDGLADLNTIRENRGLGDLTAADVPDDISFLNALLDERRAELNFEGHRLFDLARTNNVANILGPDVNAIMPIPQREIDGTNNVVKQNPGY